MGCLVHKTKGQSPLPVSDKTGFDLLEVLQFGQIAAAVGLAIIILRVILF